MYMQYKYAIVTGMVALVLCQFLWTFLGLSSASTPQVWIGHFTYTHPAANATGIAKLTVESQSDLPIERLAVAKGLLQLQGGMEITLSQGFSLHDDWRTGRFLGKAGASCDIEAEWQRESHFVITTGKDPGKTEGECSFEIDCDLSLVDLVSINKKVAIYVLIGNLFTLTQVHITLDQIDTIEVNNLGLRISPYTIIGQMAIDVFDAIFHLMLGLLGGNSSLFSSFGSLALLKFMLFSIMQTRLLIYTVRARQLDSHDSLSTAVRSYYSKFHIYILSLTIWLLLVVGSYRQILLLQQLYWIPQIILAVISGQKPSLTYPYLLLMGFSRLFTPFYMYASHGFFDGQLYPAVARNTAYVGLLAALQFVQVGILVLQKYKSPRWFVPLVFLPHIYNYYRPLPVDLEHGNEFECVICMNDVANAAQSATTPCGHIFHSQCLADWLEVKMECPTCRRPLPPMTY